MFILKILFSLLIIGLGIVILKHATITQSFIRFLRSNTANILLFGSASLWFLYHIYHLHPANFGEYRTHLLILFSIIIVCAFFYVKDFLSVRGLAVLLLLFMNTLLQATYMHFFLSNLFLNALAYITILLALTLGTIPYIFRDFLLWLPTKPKLTKPLSYLSIFIGALLALSSFF